jgi:arginyl-tRNA synthetase
MKDRIKDIILAAARRAHAQGALRSNEFPPVLVEEPKLASHGDFSTNFALVSASVQKAAPRNIAEALVKAIQDPEQILVKTEIAGPGFINFFVHPKAWYPVLRRIHGEDARYGAADLGKGLRIQIEFVSSNPTGPLHVGHGRGAAVGDSVANIMAYCGYDVQREYYINDSGRQIHTLGRSVYLRLRELEGQPVVFPEECYQGDYIRQLAAEIAAGKDAGCDWTDEPAATAFCARYAATKILNGMKADLALFGVTFDEWFSEQSLYDSGQVAAILDEYQSRGLVYEKQGALWFRTSDFGDEKDRVVVRGNGQTTYFASDIAYHEDKYRRGFERVIDVWGADHHGYIPRMTAAVEASGHRRDQFHVILVQLVNLLRGGQPVAMSTRAGEFVTLNDVIQEVGSDAARFIFLTRHHASPLEFDLELAKQKTNDNPVYYVQYVHARIASIIRKAEDRGLPLGQWPDETLGRLVQPEEIQLINTLGKYPEVVAGSAEFMEPHRITYFLMGLASDFHAYYNKHRVLEEDSELAAGRLCLVTAVQKVIRNGLTLLGVSAPQQM